jgi:hypothetical protein
MAPERARVPALSPAQLDAYRRDGFVHVQHVFEDADITRWRAEGDRLWQLVDDKASRVQWRGHDKQGNIADRIDPVMDISPEFERLAADPRLRRIAADAIGDRVNILKAKLIMKRPGTSGYGLHQDYPYWEFLGVPADSIAVVVIPLDVSNAQSGAIEFFPGRHDERIAPPKDNPFDTEPSKVDLSTGVCLELEPRDVALFHPLTPHRSAPNRSDHSRRALYYTYAGAEHGDLVEQYYANRPAMDSM